MPYTLRFDGGASGAQIARRETSDAKATPVPRPVQTHRSRCATSAPCRSNSCSRGRPLRCESPDRTKDTAQHLQPRDVAVLGRTQQALVQDNDQVRMDGGVRLRRHEDSLPATTLLGTDSAAVSDKRCSSLPTRSRLWRRGRHQRQSGAPSRACGRCAPQPSAQSACRTFPQPSDGAQLFT